MLARYLASECTEQEKLDVEKWASSGRKNKQAFDTLRKIWKLSDEKTEQWSSGRSITAFRLKLRDAEIHSHNNRRESLKLYKIVPARKAVNVFSLDQIVRVAALLLLLVGTAYMAILMKRVAQKSGAMKPVDPAAYEKISTKPGQQVTITFADGTHILLNSASSLRYADVPDGKREFYLTGEAYFEVVHSDRRPLIVKTTSAVIRDIGTKFDVEAWPGDNQTQVAVTEGEVMLTPDGRGNDQSTTITGGKYSVVKNGRITIPPSYTDVSDRIAWTRGELIFHNELMRDVFRQLQRKYGINCYASDPSIYSRTITATFTERETTDEVLRLIALSLKISYRASRDSVLFSMRNPL